MATPDPYYNNTLMTMKWSYGFGKVKMQGKGKRKIGEPCLLSVYNEVIVNNAAATLDNINMY